MAGLIYTYNPTNAKGSIILPSGSWRIECWGAQGQSANGSNIPSGVLNDGCGGLGAYMRAEFNFPSGIELIYAVGECPIPLIAHTGDKACGGGGGMTAVAVKGSSSATDIPLVVAGGGGGGTEVLRGGHRGGSGLMDDIAQGSSGGGWSVRGADSYKGNSWVTELAQVLGNAYGGTQSIGGYGGGGGGGDDNGGGGGGGYHGGSLSIPSTGGGSYIANLYEVTNKVTTSGIGALNGKIVLTQMKTPEYSLSGSMLIGPIKSSSMTDIIEFKLQGTVDIPTNTTLNMSIGFNPSGDTVPTIFNALTLNATVADLIGKNINIGSVWIKVELNSSDIFVTPSLFNPSVLIQQQSTLTTVVIELTPATRLRDPVGDITIAYSNPPGSLANQQATAVVSFTTAVDPTGLLDMPNPWHRENISAGMTNYTISAIQVYYSYFYHPAENITAAINSYSIVVTKTGSNPL